MVTVVVMSAQSFDNARNSERLDAGMYYRVGDQIAYSPDGIGCYWYDNLEQAREDNE
jgi:hypothetical protein